MFQRSQSFSNFVQNFRDTFYPICLLGEETDFRYPDLPKRVTRCLATYGWVRLSAGAQRVSTEFDSAYTWKLIKYCEAANFELTLLKGTYILHHTPNSPGYAMARFRNLLIGYRCRKAGYTAACRALKRGCGKLPHGWWRKHYGSLMVKLREYWHQVSPMFIHEEMLEKIQALLRVDVHLRMPAKMRIRFAEEVRATDATRLLRRPRE